MRKFPNIPQSALRSSTPDMEAAVNEALRRVVNDGAPLVTVLDEVFHAGFAAGYREIGANVATALANLHYDADELRDGHTPGAANANIAAGIDQAVGAVRRRTGVTPGLDLRPRDVQFAPRPAVSDDEVVFGPCGNAGCCQL